MQEKPNKNRRQVWLGILISLISLAAIFFFIQPQEILVAMQTTRYGYLIFTGLGIITFLVIRAVRWRYMLNNDAPWATVFHIQNIGYLLSAVLPLRIGDIARAVLIGSVPPITISRGISTMVVERLLDMLFIIALLPFALSGVEQIPDWMRAGSQGMGFVAIVGIIVLIIAANQSERAVAFINRILTYIPFLNTATWTARAESFLAGLDSLTNLKDAVWLILLTIATWLPIILAYYAMLLAVNLEPNLVMAAFIVCAAALSVALPSSPGQIGVFHAGVIAALQVWGQPQAQAASFAFLYHALNMAIMIGFGIVGIFATGSTFKQVLASTREFINRDESEETVSN
jgi:glycosyltransferase 2 family protein